MFYHGVLEHGSYGHGVCFLALGAACQQDRQYPAIETVVIDPRNALTCNNLAWAYARMGIHLDRALELVNASILLSDDPAVAENTLGLIYARQGDWKKAYDKFYELLAADAVPQCKWQTSA